MNRLIRFYEGYIVNNELWFSNLNYNALLKMNINTGKIQFIDKFPKFPEETRNLHIRIIKYNEFLYFIPFKSNLIHIWNLNNQNWEKTIDIPYSDNVTIEDAVLLNNEIWIFPEILKNPIIKVNVVQGTIKTLTKLTENINTINKEYASIISCGISKYNEQLLLSIYKKDCVISINSKSEQITNKYYLENISIAGIKNISDDTCCIWLTNSSDILFWNVNKNEIKAIPTNVNFYYGQRAFRNIIEIDKNRFLLLPCHTNNILIMNKLNGEINEVTLPIEFKRKSAFTLFLYAQRIKNIVYLFPCGGNKLVYINLSTMSASIIDFVITNEFKEYALKIIEKNIQREFVLGNIRETDGWNEILPKFIDMVSQKKQNHLNAEADNLGLEIYTQIKKINGDI